LRAFLAAADGLAAGLDADAAPPVLPPLMRGGAARHFPSSRSPLLAVAVVLVDGCPGLSFRLLLWNAATLIAFRRGRSGLSF
jgi:hypothetical protein